MDTNINVLFDIASRPESPSHGWAIARLSSMQEQMQQDYSARSIKKVEQIQYNFCQLVNPNLGDLL